jgi:hypothetical protein
VSCLAAAGGDRSRFAPTAVCAPAYANRAPDHYSEPLNVLPIKLVSAHR